MSASDFAPLAERIIDELLASDPALASSAGDHRYDDRLPDLSDDAVASRVAMLGDAAGALSGVDTDDLDDGARVDHEQLLSLVERALFNLTEVREHQWNPLAHNPGGLLHALVSRPFAPAAERLESVAARLAAVPDALAAARATLRECPRIHLETAAGQFRGTASFVRGEVPVLLAEAPGMASIVEPASARAIAALEDFSGWLTDRATAPNDGRDPRLGRRLWEAKLWHTLDTEMTAGEILRLAKANLERVCEELREASVGLIGGRGDDETVRAALNRLADEHPDNDSIVELAKLTLDETRNFVGDNDVVSLVDDPCVIQEMPEFARGVAVAYCDAPGPLETTGVPTFYCIAPTPADWTAERVDSFYREYNDHMVRNLTVHEAMPGHFLQLAHSRRYLGSTRARSVARSDPFVEGWAVHAEKVMADRGFGGLPIRLQPEDAATHDHQRDPRSDGPLRRHDRGRGNGSDDAARVPGGGRGRGEVAPRVADVDPAVDVLRRPQRGVRDRGGPTGRRFVAELARHDAEPWQPVPAPPAPPAQDRLNAHGHLASRGRLLRARVDSGDDRLIGAPVERRTSTSVTHAGDQSEER